MPRNLSKPALFTGLAAAAAMSANLEARSTVVSGNAPVPVAPTYVSGTLPTTPAPQQPETQRTNERVVVENVRVANLGAPEKQVAGHTKEVGQRLHAAVLGQARDGFGGTAMNRRMMSPGTRSSNAEKKEAGNSASKLFYSVQGVRVSVDPNLGERVNPRNPFGSRKSNLNAFNKWQRAAIDKLRTRGIELRVHRENKKAPREFFFYASEYAASFDDNENLNLFAGEMDFRDMRMCMVVLRQLRNNQGNWYVDHRKNYQEPMSGDLMTIDEAIALDEREAAEDEVSVDPYLYDEYKYADEDVVPTLAQFMTELNGTDYEPETIIFESPEEAVEDTRAEITEASDDEEWRIWINGVLGEDNAALETQATV